MKHYVLYEQTTGRIVQSGTGGAPDSNPGYAVLFGVPGGDFRGYRVDVGAEPPSLVALPPRPSENHEFDYVAKVWKLNTQQAAWKARAERDRRIAATDWTQLPDIPEAVRSKWQDYRQALRDVTLQPGFPERIDWPVPPG